MILNRYFWHYDKFCVCMYVKKAWQLRCTDKRLCQCMHREQWSPIWPYFQLNSPRNCSANLSVVDSSHCTWSNCKHAIVLHVCWNRIRLNGSRFRKAKLSTRRLRVAPLSLSPSCVTRKETVRKNGRAISSFRVLLAPMQEFAQPFFFLLSTMIVFTVALKVCRRLGPRWSY